MLPTQSHRSIVLATALSLTTGCGLFAPLQPLPVVDAGVDVDAMDANPVVPEPGNDGSATDGATEVSTDGAMETAYEAGEGGPPPDPGRDAAPEVGDAGDAAPDLPDDGAAIGDAGEAGSAPDAGVDGVPPVVLCDPSMPFGEPVLVYGLNRTTGTEQRMSISPDELNAYVAVGAVLGSTHLYFTNRTSTSQPFGPLMALTQLNGPGDEISVSVTRDGLTLFMDADWGSMGRIYAATRQAPGQALGAPNLVQMQMGGDQFDPYVLPNGSALYFTSNATGLDNPTGLCFFYRAALDGTKTAVPTLAFAKNARFPIVSDDELTLYFATDSTPGADWGDIWMATRPSRDVPFDEPMSVTELNTTHTEYPQSISSDGCRLYLARWTDHQSGFYSFVAERMHN